MKREVVLILSLMTIKLACQQVFSVDNFIVDEDVSYENKIAQQNQAKKKASVLRPVHHNMAMSLQPKDIVIGKSLGYKRKPLRTENADKRLHIAPTINLVQTLKTLNDIGEAKTNRNLHKVDVKEIVKKNSKPVDEERLAKNAQILESEKPKELNTSNSKKDAQPNMLTDTPLKGFLSRDTNFTIDDIGNAAKQKKSNNTESKKQSSLSALSPDNKTVVPNMTIYELNTSHDGIILKRLSHGNSSNSGTTNVSNNVMASFAQNKSRLNYSEKNSTQKAVIDKDTQPNISVKRTKNPKIHLFDVEEFTKIHYSNKSISALKKDSIDANHDECNDDKKCPKNKYCRHFVCHECHRKHHECVEDDQCCDDLPCVYGRCDDKPKKSPGSICHKDGDCNDGCCVLEPTIDEQHGICKVKLAEYHQCSPVLFRKVWVGEDKPKCGPCQDGLECVEKGVIASHLICMKKH